MRLLWYFQYKLENPPNAPSTNIFRVTKNLYILYDKNALIHTHIHTHKTEEHGGTLGEELNPITQFRKGFFA